MGSGGCIELTCAIHGSVLVFSGTEKREEHGGPVTQLLTVYEGRTIPPSLHLCFIPFPCRDSSPYTMALGEEDTCPFYVLTQGINISSLNSWRPNLQETVKQNAIARRECSGEAHHQAV